MPALKHDVGQRIRTHNCAFSRPFSVPQWDAEGSTGRRSVQTAGLPPSSASRNVSCLSELAKLVQFTSIVLPGPPEQLTAMAPKMLPQMGRSVASFGQALA